MKISAVVLTKNEQKNIAGCLKSLQWCDEVIVVDDFSEDKTVDIAVKMGVRVFKRRLENDFSAQRNFALKKTVNDWVFFVDADEKVPEDLKKEIIGLQKNRMSREHKTKGYFIKRKDKFLGRWLNYGETSKIKLLRLADKNAGVWKRPVHEIWDVKGKKTVLKNHLLHNRKMTVSDFIKKIDKYSSIRAEELLEKNSYVNIFLVIAFPIGKFIDNYFLRLGCLDGFPGFAIAFLMSLHSFLVRAKTYLKYNCY